MGQPQLSASSEGQGRPVASRPQIARSRKARNLAARPHCTVAARGGHGEAIVVVEGVATPVTDPSLRAGCEASYGAQYPESMPPGEPVYAVEPRVAFGLGEEPFTETATRWVFPT